MKHLALLTAGFFLLLPACSPEEPPHDEAFRQAGRNARDANQGFRRCVAFVHAWLEQADPQSGLIPRNLRDDRDIWNARDSAADNYPFMVLTAAILDRGLFEGRMSQMLQSERTLTSRIRHLPDTYSFSKQGFLDADPDLGRIIFGASEYVKDGLLPLTEWLGPSPWSERMLELLDEIWAEAPVETPFGRIASDNVEVNGEMLQALSRVYWMTGDPKYLEWALRLGDYYLLGEHHPTRDLPRLRLRDHGCEIVSGLTEVYATVHFARPEKGEAYRAPVHAMLDRILEVGRNEHGLFYNQVNPITGEILDDGVADTWGYTLNGFYTVYLVDREERYRQAVMKALSSLEPHYHGYDWERGSADGDADSIESGLNLYNRERLDSVRRWLDREVRILWGKQQPSGLIEGWHGDGNFARTTMMYCLWKSAGVTARPWRDDLLVGGLLEENALYVTLSAEDRWEGLLLFDQPRHSVFLNLPIDWPRINQFPEWFTADPLGKYRLSDLSRDSQTVLTGESLVRGIQIELEPGTERRLVIREEM